MALWNAKQQYRTLSRWFNFSTILSKKFKYLIKLLLSLLATNTKINYKCLNWFSLRKYFSSVMTNGLSEESCFYSIFVSIYANFIFWILFYLLFLQCWVEKERCEGGQVHNFSKKCSNFVFPFQCIQRLFSNEISTSEIEL